jgi:hypothetical protein
VTIRLPLSQGLEAIIDDVDADQARFKWHVVKYSQNRYAQREIRKDGRRTTIHLHTAILNTPQHLRVDHINGDGLDNRRCNLRLVSVQENSFNHTKKKQGCTSRYRGVCWVKRRGKWKAAIQVDGRTYNLGSFASEIEAARAYDRAGFERDPHHFTPNFPEGT